MKHGKLRHKKIRRGGRASSKSRCVTFYYVNINGVKSKSLSLSKILCEQGVDVALITETKVYSRTAIQLHGYQIFPVVRKSKQGGGLAIAIKHNLCSSLLIDEGDNAEFITVKLIFGNIILRVILCYGPQEYADEEEKLSFFEKVSLQIERASIVGEKILLIGDFNAKLGREYIAGDYHDMSPNGKYLFDLWQNFKLTLLNSKNFCNGIFTRVKQKRNDDIEKSVIDYAFCSPDLSSLITSLDIDEDKVFTPWRKLKKGYVFSDHCAMLIKCNISTKKLGNRINTGNIWNFNDDVGWEKFRASTEKCSSLKKVWEKCSDVNRSYEKWCKKLNKILHQCFTKKRVRDKPLPFNKEIRTLLNEKKVLKKKYKTCKIKNVRKQLKAEITKMDKMINEKISHFNFSLISNNVKTQGFSQNEFWKVKKKLFPKSQTLPHSIIDHNGNEVTEPLLILQNYRKVMMHRLRKRNIKASLKDFECAMNDLCTHRLQKSKHTPSPEYTYLEVKSAIDEFKQGKSYDPAGFIREIFIRAGSDLVYSIVEMLNSMKKVHQIPSLWADMLMVTLYKNKGTRKNLDNYRGIFLVMIVELIFEKVLKNRINPILQENITKFQNGGMKGKGVIDNLFIIRGIIDHAKYLGKEVFITFYDIEKCFDSLWLQDCLNSLWDNGVQDDTLYFIYLLNKEANITVNTPFGNTLPFTLSNLVKQGTVMGPVLNNCSLDRMSKESSGYQMGLVNIKSLEFVDDIADPNRCLNSVYQSNKILEQVQVEKRLLFSSSKCELLRCSSDGNSANDHIHINGRKVKNSSCSKYLGDQFNCHGSNSDLISSRVNRAKGSIIELISICKEAKFSSKQLDAMLLLYKTVFQPRLLYNCEAWSRLTKSDIASLQKVQLGYLRSMMEVPYSTPLAGLYIELGILPIQYEIDIKKLNFLWKILQKQHDDPVKKVYIEMKRNPFEKNWANEMMDVRLKYNLSTCDDEVECTGIYEWKRNVKTAVFAFALQQLTAECKKNSKSKMIACNNFARANYITGLLPDQARIIFRVRLGMFEIKSNFKNKYKTSGNLKCPLCDVDEETLHHITTCSVNIFAKKYNIEESHFYSANLHKLKKCAKFLKAYKNFKDELSAMS